MDQFNVLNLPNPIEIQGSNFNLKTLSKGKFVYEGYRRNRFIRYTGDKIFDLHDIRDYRLKRRSHNIDFMGCRIIIENNDSKSMICDFKSTEDSEKVMRFLVGDDLFNDSESKFQQF